MPPTWDRAGRRAEGLSRYLGADWSRLGTLLVAWEQAGLVAPYIFADGHNRPWLEWEKGDRFLAFLVRAGDLEYSRFLTSNRNDDEDEGAIPDDAAPELIRWVEDARIA